MDADVTPELIEEIDFSEKFRGYDPDQVDRFLERVGATLVTHQERIEELSARAQRAEAEVAALRERPAPAPAAAPAAAPSDDEQVEQASRTLLLAQRTADAAVAEARQEATTLIADARARAEAETRDATVEADRLVAEAQAQRDDMLRVAREDADRETVHVREQLLNEIGLLEGRKEGLLADVTALESHVGHYRSRLGGVHEALGALLDDPEALTVTPHGVDPSPSSAFYYTGSNPVVSGAESTTLASTGKVEVVVVDRDDAVPPPEFVTPDEVAPAEVAPAEVAPADPWAPGSWSEVSAVLEERDSGTLFADETSTPSSPFDDVFEPAHPDAEGVAASTVDQPTEAYDMSGDRHLRDLDAAVNEGGEADDEAMAAFFEAQPQAERRFGRRR